MEFPKSILKKLKKTLYKIVFPSSVLKNKLKIGHVSSISIYYIFNHNVSEIKIFKIKLLLANTK